MQKSESIVKISKALSNFQGEIKNPGNTADNPFYKSKYAPLNDVLNTVRPILAKNGLSIIQAPGGNGDSISIITILLHESGEWLEFEPLVIKAEKLTAQGMGSAVTYGRRYSLSAILGISSEDDDDGNELETTVKPNKKPIKPQVMSDEKWADFWDKTRNMGYELAMVEEIAGLSAEDIHKLSPAQVAVLFKKIANKTA